jgi:DNA-binding protein HU-beta
MDRIILGQVTVKIDATSHKAAELRPAFLSCYGTERIEQNSLFHIRAEICGIIPIGRSTVNPRCANEVTPLIKQDIVHHVIERTGLPRTKAEAAVDTVFEGLKQALTAGERIELRGFGVFSVRARKTGIGRNPRTGTEVSITPGKAVRFKPGKELHTLESGGPAKV